MVVGKLADSRLAIQVAAYLFFVVTPFGIVIDGLRTGVIFWPQTGLSESRSDGWWFWFIAAVWVCIGVLGIWILRT